MSQNLVSNKKSSKFGNITKLTVIAGALAGVTSPTAISHGFSSTITHAHADDNKSKAATQNNNQQNNGQDLKDANDYTVQSGDTLNKISQRKGIDLDTLLSYNENLKANKDMIHVGDKVNLVQQADQGNTHKVVEGDTLNKIAQLDNVSLNDLYTYNNLSDSNNTIYVGDDIKIKPDATTPTTEVQVNNTDAANQAAQPAQATPQAATQTTQLSGSTAQKIVQAAQQYSGVPYVFGGSTPSGFDCSGFTQYVYAQAGISLPRTSQAQSLQGTPKSVSAAQPGDLLFWGGQGASYHVGIALGNGQFIAAPQPGDVVRVQPISSSFMPSFAESVG